MEFKRKILIACAISISVGLIIGMLLNAGNKKDATISISDVYTLDKKLYIQVVADDKVAKELSFQALIDNSEVVDAVYEKVEGVFAYYYFDVAELDDSFQLYMNYKKNSDLVSGFENGKTFEFGKNRYIYSEQSSTFKQKEMIHDKPYNEVVELLSSSLTNLVRVSELEVINNQVFISVTQESKHFANQYISFDTKGERINFQLVDVYSNDTHIKYVYMLEAKQMQEFSLYLKIGKGPGDVSDQQSLVLNFKLE